MADIVLINPRFEASYWGMEYALPILGRRANVPVACLPLLAALTPPGHTVTLLDENVEPIDFERVARADIVVGRWHPRTRVLGHRPSGEAAPQADPAGALGHRGPGSVDHPAVLRGLHRDAAEPSDPDRLTLIDSLEGGSALIG